MSDKAAQDKAREKDADKMVKEAKGLCGPSFLGFRFKPDWEGASPLLEKAALAYKVLHLTDKALAAYELAAVAQERQGSSWHAAKDMDACADLCKQAGQWDKVSTYIRNAASQYAQAGKPVTGAEALVRGAKILEEKDPEDAIKMYYEALDLYEDDGKAAQSADAFRAAIAALVKAQKYAQAVELQMRFGASCDTANAHGSQAKCYLGAVVTALYAQDAGSAWAAYQDALGVETFVSCEEAFSADSLFEAYRSGSKEKVRKVVGERHVFKSLDNQVAKLASKLPSGPLKTMAQELHTLAGTGGGEGEEELADDVL